MIVKVKSMTQFTPINPLVLQWARTTAGLTVEEVVKKLNRKKITAETIIAWENGEPDDEAVPPAH